MTDMAAIRTEFLGRINFRPSLSKLESCMKFLRAAWPYGTADDIRLALLVAEQSHMSVYGRPVTGCQYLVSDGIVVLAGSVTNETIPAKNDGTEAALPVHDIDAMEDAFPNLSGSDLQHMTRAVTRCTSDRPAIMEEIRSWIHEGKADYALMVAEDDAERLLCKLDDLSSWGKYFYLGK